MALVTKIMGAGMPAGAVNMILADVQDSLTATGTDQDTAQKIGTGIARFATVAASSGAILPAGAVGDEVMVINAGANALSVYPPVGHSINAGSADAAFSLSTASSIIVKRISNLLWIAQDSSQMQFVQSGTGAIARDMQSARRDFVTTADFDTEANYDTARDLLTARLGVGGLDITRTAGTVATGAVLLNDFLSTFTGHSGGGSQVDALRILHTSNGANAVDQAIAGRFTAQITGSGAVSALRGVLAEVRVDGVGDVSGALGLSTQFIATSTGNVVTNVQNIRVASPSITSTCAVPAIEGLRVSNQGHANIVDVFGVKIEDQTDATGNIYGFYSNITSGAAKWAHYMAGSAKSHFGGNVLIGSTTDGTQPLQVTGTGEVVKLNVTNNAYMSVDDGTVDVGLGIISALGFFGTISNHGLNISTNNSQRISISNAGVVTIHNLAGTGSRTVVVDENGVLSAP